MGNIELRHPVGYGVWELVTYVSSADSGSAETEEGEGLEFPLRRPNVIPLPQASDCGRREVLMKGGVRREPQLGVFFTPCLYFLACETVEKLFERPHHMH